MTNKLLSICIPIYNGAGCISRCLGSIVDQGVDPEVYEVICVDDCSSDSTVEVVEQYGQSHPELPLRLVQHSVNKRRGGGCNTAVESTQGEYVIYLDCDDLLIPRSLPVLLDVLKESRLDILMYDTETYNSADGSCQRGLFLHNSTEPLPGRRFLRERAIPWVSWHYAYRREFLKENNIRFVEEHSFEDVDYTLRATAAASMMQYRPLILIRHILHSKQTTQINNDIHKIEELFMQSHRVRLLAEEWMGKDMSIAHVIMGHHWYGYYMNVLRYAWRLPYDKIRYLLTTYPTYLPTIEMPHKYNLQRLVVYLCVRSPQVLALLLSVLRPILPLARRIVLKSHFAL